MSKFMYLGLSAEQAVEKVTAAPARMFKFPEQIGTLQPGSVADVSVLGVEEGTFTFLDSKRQPRVGRHRITPVATTKSGTVAARL